jgi:pimeloyl-ACP methyl ester carboxylesterase
MRRIRPGEGLDRYVANLTESHMPGVSHWVQEEAPEAINEIVTGFLRKTLPTARSSQVV